MNKELRKEIYRNLNQKETEELIEIWQGNDRVKWSEATFEVLKTILQQRLGTLPVQDEPVFEYSINNMDLDEEEKNIGKLLDDLESPDPFLRKTAAEQIGELKITHEFVIETLKSVAESDDNKYVREAAVKSLTSLGINAPLVVSEEMVQPSIRDLLERLVQLQEKENSSLLEIQKHTSCLYMYLIASLVIGGLLFLISFVFSR